MLDPYFQRAKERRFKAIRNVIYWSIIEKNIVNDADGVLFTSETELLLARETFKSYNRRSGGYHNYLKTCNSLVGRSTLDISVVLRPLT